MSFTSEIFTLLHLERFKIVNTLLHHEHTYSIDQEESLIDTYVYLYKKIKS